MKGWRNKESDQITEEDVAIHTSDHPREGITFTKTSPEPDLAREGMRDRGQ